MKKILVLTIFVLLIAGCEMTPYQRQVWGEAFQNMAQMQHEQNLAQWRYSQPQLGPIIYPGRSQNNSTYWQEQRAEQEYWDTYQQKARR